MKKKRFWIFTFLFFVVFILSLATAHAVCCVNSALGGECYNNDPHYDTQEECHSAFPGYGEFYSSLNCDALDECIFGCCCAEEGSYALQKKICGELYCSDLGCYTPMNGWGATFPTNGDLICMQECENIQACSFTNCEASNPDICYCSSALTNPDTGLTYCCIADNSGNGQVYQSQLGCRANACSPSGFSISGYVKSTSGIGIEGAAVSLGEPPGYSTTTSYGGSFTILHIPPQEGTVRATATGYRPGNSPYDTTLGSQTGIVIQLPPIRRETVCNNGVDDDEDGLTDCEDPDCSITESTEHGCCSDTADNDLNGCSDEQDWKCGGVEIDCSASSGDEDCDGLLNCNDPDCTDDPLCAGVCIYTFCEQKNTERCICGNNFIDAGKYCCVQDGSSYSTQTNCYNVDYSSPYFCIPDCELSAAIDSSGNPSPSGLAQCVCEGNLIKFNDYPGDYCCEGNIYSEDGPDNCPGAVTKFTVTGIVKERITGAVVGGAWVSISEQGFAKATVSGDDGSFIFAEIPRGDYSLVASKTCYNSLPGQISVSSDLSGVVVELEPLKKITLNNLVQNDITNDPIQGATVEITTPPYGGYSCTTDANGACIFSVCVGEPVNLIAWKIGFEPVRKVVQLVKETQEITTIFRLKPIACGDEATTQPPNNLKVKDVYLKPELSLQWDNPCMGSLVDFSVFRCNTLNQGTCSPTELVGKTKQTSFTDNNFNKGLKPETTYCYAIGANYGGWYKYSGVVCEDTGQSSCLKAPEEFGTYEYCSKKGNLDCRIGCDEENIATEIGCCSPGEKCEGPYNGETWCTAREYCDECSRPLGMFNFPDIELNYPNPSNPLDTISTQCSEIPFCYSDYTNTTADTYYSCYKESTLLPELSCYDFKSEEACLEDNCELTGCEYAPHPDYGELGKGVCRPETEEEQHCELCEENQGFFMKCDEQTCPLYGNCYLGSKSGCAGPDDLMCGEYRTKADCTGGRPVWVNVSWDEDFENKIRGDNKKNPSNDKIGLGVCRWGTPYGKTTPGCYKDADNNLRDDCQLNWALCRDKEPPQTVASYLDKTTPTRLLVLFNVVDETQEGLKLYFCSDRANSCYPSTEIPLSDGVGKVENGDFNFDGEGGVYYLRFFAEDASHNLERVQSIMFYIDNEIVVAIGFLAQPDQTIPGITLTDLTVAINPGEPAYCSGSLSVYNSNNWAPVPGNNPLTQGLQETFSIFYNNLEDGYYKYHYSCMDDLGNQAEGDEYTYLDANQKIYSPYPQGTLAEPPSYLGLRTRQDASCTWERVDRGQSGPFEKKLGPLLDENNLPFYSYIHEGGLNLDSIVAQTLVYNVYCSFEDGSAQDAILFTIDKEPPATTITVPKIGDRTEYDPSVYKPEHRFKLSCVDQPELETPGDFGCSKTFFCIAGSACTPDQMQNANSGAVITINSETENMLCYYSNDGGGNREDTKCAVFNLDKESALINSITLTYGESPVPTKNEIPVIGIGKIYTVTIESNEPLSSVDKFYYQAEGFIQGATPYPQESIPLTPDNQDRTVWEGTFLVPNLEWYKKEKTAGFFIKATDSHGTAPSDYNAIESGEFFLIDGKKPDMPLFYLTPTESTPEYQLVYSTNEGFNIPGNASEPRALVTLYRDYAAGSDEYTATSAQESNSIATYQTFGEAEQGYNTVRLNTPNLQSQIFNKYIEFAGSIRLDHRRYFVTFAKTESGYTELILDKPLEKTIAHNTEVYAYNEEHEVGWFEFNINLQKGENELSARATDLSGNQGELTHPVWIVLYDPDKPEIMVTPPDGTKTGDTELTVGAISIEDATGIDIGSIKLTIDGGANNPRNGDYVCRSNELECVEGQGVIKATYKNIFSEGDYNLKLEASDMLGNLASAEWHFTIDSKMPTTPLLTLHPGNKVNGIWFVNRTTNFNIYLNFSDALEVQITKLILDNSEISFTKIYFNKFKTTISQELTPNAKHNLTIKARKRLAEGQEEWSNEGLFPKYFVIDTFAPKITLNRAATNNYQSAGVNGRYNDTPPNKPNIDNVRYIILEGGVEPVKLYPPQQINKLEKTYSGTIELNPELQYPITIKATAYDKAGNSNFAEGELNYDGTPPEILSVSLFNENIYCAEELAEGDCITNISKVGISGRLSEAGLIHISLTDYLIAENTQEPITIITNENGLFEKEVSLEDNGEAYTLHSINITAEDIAANPAINKADKMVILDKVPPEIEFIDPPNDQKKHHTNVLRPVIKIQTNKPAACKIDFGTGYSDMELTNSLNLPEGFSFLNGLGFATIHSKQAPASLTNKEYSFNVDCVDYLGNEKEQGFRFTIDSNSPDLKAECKFTNNGGGDIPCGQIAVENENLIKYRVVRNEPSSGLPRVRITAFDIPEALSQQDELRCHYICSFNNVVNLCEQTSAGAEGDFIPSPAFSLSPNQTVQFTADVSNGVYSYSIDCEDRAGNHDYYILELDVDYLEGLVILERAPQGYTNKAHVILHLLTNVPSVCEYHQSLFSWVKFSENYNNVPSEEHTINLGAIGEGNYSYNIRCIDEQQNKIGYDGAEKIEFAVDRTPPEIYNLSVSDTLVLCSQVSGGKCIEYLTGSDSLTIKGDLTETAIDEVEFTVKGPSEISTKYPATTQNNRFTSSITLDSFGQEYSTHYVVINATDLAGNYKIVQTSVLLDKKPPESITLTPNATAVKHPLISVSGKVFASPNTAEPNAIVELYVNDNFVKQTTADNSGAYQEQLTLTNSGLNIIKAAAYDKFGTGPVEITEGVYLITAGPIFVSINPADNSITNPNCRAIDEVRAVITERDNAGINTQNSIILLKNSTGTPIPGTNSFAVSNNPGCLGSCIELVFTSSSPLAESTYTATIHAVDNLGNSVDYAKQFQVSITAPCLLNLRAQAANCFITSEKPYYTACSSVNILGTVFTQTDIEVHLFLDNSEQASQTFLQGENGDFSFALNLNADKKYTVRADAIDTLGRVARDTFEITRDTLTPNVSIIIPVDGYVTSKQQTGLFGGVYGKWNDSNKKKLEIYSNDNLFSTINPSSISGQENYLEPDLMLASRLTTIKVKAYDMAGKTKTATANVILDTEKPILSITSVFPSVEITAGQRYKTAENSVLVSGTYDEEEEIRYIKQLPNNNASINPAAKTFSIEIGLQPGENSIVLEAEDTAGNKGVYTFIIELDKKPPVITSFSPETNTSSLVKPTLTITTDETASCKILYTSNSGFEQQQNFITNGLSHSLTFEYELPFTREGTQTKTTNMNIICRDLFGNEGSTILRFTVDLRAPVITDFKAIGIGAIFESQPDSNTKNYLLTGNDLLTQLVAETDEQVRCKYSFFNAENAPGAIPSYSELTTQFRNFISWTTTANSETINYLEDQQRYVFYLACEDKAYLPSITKTINLETNKHHLLGIYNITPANFTNNPLPTIRLKTIKNAKCILTSPEDARIWEGNNKYTEREMQRSSDGKQHTAKIAGINTPATPLLEKAYSFNIRCEDIQGQLETNQISYSFIVDLTPPEVEIIYPQDGFETNTPSLNIEARVTEANPDYLQIYANGVKQLPYVHIPQIQNPLEKEISLVPGTNNLVVEFVDMAGNSGTAEITVNFDNQGPTVEIISPANKGPFRSLKNILAELKENELGGGVDIEASYIELEGPFVPVAITKHTSYISSRDTYLLNYSIESELSDGEYKLAVYSFNLAGAQGESPIKYFTINTNIPEVTFISPGAGDRVSSPTIHFIGNINTYGQILTKAQFVLNDEIVTDIVNKVGAGGGNFDLDLSKTGKTLKEGYNNYYLIVETSLGNAGESPSSYVYLDTTGPMPVLVIIGDTTVFGQGVEEFCEDTDNGINYYQAGETNRIYTDCCVSERESTICSGTNLGGFLREAYCENDKSEYLNVRCPRGCESGACISGGGTPDLVVSDISWNPANPVANQEFSVSVTIINQGTAPILEEDEFDISLLIYKDSMFSPSYLDTKAVKQQIPRGGKYTTVFGDVTLGSGSYTLAANADSSYTVIESKEENNVKIKTITVSG